MAKRQKVVRRKGTYKRRSLAMVNTGTSKGMVSGPNKEVVAEYHYRVQSLKTGEPVPPTLNLTMDKATGDDAIPRAVVLNLLWQGDKRQGVVKFLKQLLVDRYRYKLWLYFCRDMFFFFEEDISNKVARRSIVYGSMENAFIARKRNKITWAESMSVKAHRIPPG